MDDKQYVDFEIFLNKFETLPFPVMIDDNSYQYFNEKNTPLPDVLVSLFLERTGKEEEFAEYVPAFRIPDLHGCTSIVFWRAGLLEYAYFLATFTKEGGRIDQKLISKTYFTDDNASLSIVKFEAEGLVTVIENTENLKMGALTPSHSKHLYFEIMEDGSIHQSSKLSI